MDMDGWPSLWAYGVINADWDFYVLPFRAEPTPFYYAPPLLPVARWDSKMDTTKKRKKLRRYHKTFTNCSLIVVSTVMDSTIHNLMYCSYVIQCTL